MAEFDSELLELYRGLVEDVDDAMNGELDCSNGLQELCDTLKIDINNIPEHDIEVDKKILRDVLMMEKK